MWTFTVVYCGREQFTSKRRFATRDEAWVKAREFQEVTEENGNACFVRVHAVNDACA